MHTHTRVESLGRSLVGAFVLLPRNARLLSLHGIGKFCHAQTISVFSESRAQTHTHTYTHTHRHKHTHTNKRAQCAHKALASCSQQVSCGVLQCLAVPCSVLQCLLSKRF